MEDMNTATALSTTCDLDRWPSIFEDGDNVYDTYSLPSEDPRKAKHYVKTGAGTPRAKKSRA